ncbi:hypothetical protein M3Y95_01121700 [Aphelenchoides besseyi]|nr:hypothetical protein M3Y95_01121700 [Aphelenchoides besseyi]
MSKAQLTTYSKAILLMHRSEYVCNRPRDNTMSAFEFFKYLLISRQFLRASQLYQVYRFAIFEYSSDDKKFDVSAMKGGFAKVWATHFKLTLEEIQTWNQFLNVQYVDLFKYRYKYAEEFSAVSRFFTGYIALNLFSDIDEAENHNVIIRQLQKQLYSLCGHAKSIIDYPKTLRLNLMNSSLDIENLYEFKQVLTKHRIKELCVGNSCVHSSRFDPTIDDNFFNDFPTCPSVEKLKFTWKDLDEIHNLVWKVTKMMPFFPNLSELLCCFRAEHYTLEQFSLQKLVAWIRKECRKIEELQKTSLSITNIALVYVFKIRKPESRKVVKQSVKEILKTTKFKQLRSAKHIIPEAENDENDVPIKQYCDLELWRKQPNCLAALEFTVDLDPHTLNDDNESEDELTEDESTEHDDN